MANEKIFESKVKENFEIYDKLQTKEEKDHFVKNILLEREDLQIQKLLADEQIALLKSRQFGKKSEKQKDNPKYKQVSMFDEGLVDPNMDVLNEAEEIKEETKGEEETETITYTRKKRRNKVNLDESIEVKVVEHKLEKENCKCKVCGKELDDIGYTTVRTYEYIPAKIVVNEHHEHSYKCKCCSTDIKDSIFKVKRNTSFPKAMVEDSFIAHIIYDKYYKHLPLYRQEKVFLDLGLEVTRKNLSNWILQASNVLEPIFNLMYEYVLKQEVIHMDETTLNVLSDTNQNSYIWGICTSRFDKPVYLYFYKPTREYKNANELLKGFKGYIHSDGYEAYQRVENATDVACFAHARRKYTEITKVIKKPEESKFGKLAIEGRNFINKLYKIEDEIRDKSIEERYSIRQEKSKPILDAYFEWCTKNPLSAYSQFAITKAINYSLNIKEYLSNYLLDGRLEIDNNRAERMMKTFVIGRKNFLFCVSQGGAEASAMLYSIVETAHYNNLKIEAYLTYVFKTMPTLTKDEYSKLLPFSDTLPEELRLKK